MKRDDARVSVVASPGRDGQKAAEPYAILDLADDWAREQYNPGHGFRDVPQSDAPGKWQLAVESYRQVLMVRTNERAALHNNPGNAYRCLPASTDAIQRNIRRALSHFEPALEVRQRARHRHPYEHAATEFNRGQAYAKQAEPDASAGFAEAAWCFRGAEECFLICRDRERAAAHAGLTRLDLTRQDRI